MTFFRSTLLLLGIGLLASSGVRAIEEYSGPNEDPAVTWAIHSGNVCPSIAPTAGTIVNGAQLLACVVEAGIPETDRWARNGSCATTYGPVSALPTSNMNGHLWLCTAAGVPNGDLANESVSCANAANRDLATIGGTLRCVSKCYSLRGQEVSVFVPIESPSQNVTAACLFIAGRGSCELEVVDASNYTYGTQLYRGGTFAHVGQRCTEDATNPPTTGAVTNSPAGGTGGGSGSTTISEGDTGAKATALASELTAERVAAGSGLDVVKDVLEGPKPTFMPPDGRWMPTLAGFFPSVESCTLTVGHVLMNTRPNLALSISFCDWAPYLRDFLYYVFGFTTLWVIWSTVFSPRSA